MAFFISWLFALPAGCDCASKSVSGDPDEPALLQLRTFSTSTHFTADRRQCELQPEDMHSRRPAGHVQMLREQNLQIRQHRDDVLLAAAMSLDSRTGLADLAEPDGRMPAATRMTDGGIRDTSTARRFQNWYEVEETMCISCDSGDCGPVHVRESDILRRAREIEAAMPGERVSDKSWAVFSGVAGGSILFKEYRRLYCSYEEADASA